jgi:hypothetical protein
MFVAEKTLHELISNQFMTKLISNRNIIRFFFQRNESELMRFYEVYQKQLGKLLYTRIQKIIKLSGHV